MPVNRKFYTCSVGSPGANYVEENLERIIKQTAFILDEGATQKGVYEEISKGDLLILKYNRRYIAYGEAIEILTTDDEDWNLWAPVKEWYFKNPDDPREGVSRYGIDENTVAGGKYGTVKEIEKDFAIEKLGQIDSNSSLYKSILFEINNDIVMGNTKEIIDILQYKHQIILQGPPGTGKTRMAKLLADDLAISNSNFGADVLNEDIIKEKLKIGLELSTPTSYNTFKIISLTDKNVKVYPKDAKNEYNISYEAIKECIIVEGYKKAVKESDTNGTASYVVSLAKYIVQKLIEDQIKLIQFHPSYTYEDFVRGIIALPNGSAVEYKTENRILAKIAADALQNYIDSKKDVQILSKEKWIQQMFDGFKNQIVDFLDEHQKYPISKSVNIFEVEEEAFRYTGNDWFNKTGLRMKFKDIFELELNQVKSIDDIKKVSSISGLARNHPGYYLTILQKFRDYLKDKEQPGEVQKIKERNFVMIIDEINRANLPSVLGELIYALEYRGAKVESMYELDGDRNLVLPPNLYIIGTMNTADRSVGHIDYAIRRRFAFVDVLPEEAVIDEVIKDEAVKQKAKLLFQDVSVLFNKTVSDTDKTLLYLAADFKAKDIQIGHSYFLADTEAKLRLKLEYEIKPILNEYVKDGILSESAISVINDLKV